MFDRSTKTNFDAVLDLAKYAAFRFNMEGVYAAVGDEIAQVFEGGTLKQSGLYADPGDEGWRIRGLPNPCLEEFETHMIRAIGNGPVLGTLSQRQICARIFRPNCWR
ncbi:hypothetical protein quinque_007700 [Culex quinquefasciatus]